MLLKAELAATGHAITLLESGGQDLLDLEATLKKLFDLGLQIKRLLTEIAVGKSTPGLVTGVKLPKVDILSFDGNILNGAYF